MEKMEIKRMNNNISLYNENLLIEEYKLTEAIDFRSLMNFLIKDELSNKYKLICDEDLNLNEEEHGLISIIKTIIEEYNMKIDEFDSFVNTMKK